MGNKTKDEKMDAKEAFETLFGFDITDFGDVYDNSCMGSMFKTLKEAREVKKAYETLKENFYSWKQNFSIYKYSIGWHAVKVSSQVELHDGIEKIE